MNLMQESQKGSDIVSEIVERYAETRRINTLLQSVKNLMKNVSFSLDQAFNNLEVSDKDRLIITKALQEESLSMKSMI